MNELTKRLRFYFVTDDIASGRSMLEQVRIALDAGATIVQYRNKQFDLHHYDELMAIKKTCRTYSTPLLINDNVLLAKAVAADGVHLGQSDEPAQLAREILGPKALVGLSVSSTAEMAQSPIDACDYLGCGPVYATDTKRDADPACHLRGLQAVVAQSSLPVVAIGGISADNAHDCFNQGVAGVAVISAITRSNNPEKAAHALAAACGIKDD